jgi:hypothetical protein
MRVDGQLLAGLKIKVQNFEVGRIMDEQTTQAAVLKTVFLKHAYFFHAVLTPFCPVNWIETSWCLSRNSISPPSAEGDEGEGDIIIGRTSVIFHPHLHPPPSRGRRKTVFPDGH